MVEGTRPYFSPSHSGNAVAAMHDHANNIRTVGKLLIILTPISQVKVAPEIIIHQPMTTIFSLKFIEPLTYYTDEHSATSILTKIVNYQNTKGNIICGFIGRKLCSKL